MIHTIILDSTPLGLLLQRVGLPAADAARQWVLRHEKIGNRFVVPEIAAYEVRRELKRLQLTRSLASLDDFIRPDSGRFLALKSPALELASTLWADSRRGGQSTADPHALDIDVILAAQVLTSSFDLAATIVATSNVKHLAPMVPAKVWSGI